MELLKRWSAVRECEFEALTPILITLRGKDRMIQPGQKVPRGAFPTEFSLLGLYKQRRIRPIIPEAEALA